MKNTNKPTTPKIAIKKQRFSAIPLRTLFYISWTNIRTKKLRSSLTILGVVIGIGAIFFLLSFGIGLQNLVSKQIIGDASIKSIEVSSPNSKIIKLNDEAINDIRSFAHASKVGTLYSFPGNAKLNGGESGSIIYGVDNNYMSISSITLSGGRNLTNDDKDVALVSKGVLKALGVTDDKKALDQTIDLEVPLNNVDNDPKPIKGKYKIVGIVDSTNGTEIYIPGYVFGLAGVQTFSQVKVVADSANNVPALRKKIEGRGLETVSPIDTLEQINQVFKFFNIMLVGLGAIGMIVAVLGMFNTLVISLLERTREIGLMIALGGRKTDMRKLFIFEATLLSFIGSVLGIILAILLGQIVNFVMNRFAAGRGVEESFQLFATPPWLIISLIIFMIVVGWLVVFFPARRAERINPIDALRRE